MFSVLTFRSCTLVEPLNLIHECALSLVQSVRVRLYLTESLLCIIANVIKITFQLNDVLPHGALRLETALDNVFKLGESTKKNTHVLL